MTLTTPLIADSTPARLQPPKAVRINRKQAKRQLKSRIQHCRANTGVHFGVVHRQQKQDGGIEQRLVAKTTAKNQAAAIPDLLRQCKITKHELIKEPLAMKPGYYLVSLTG